MRLERSAGELRGEVRVAALRRWVAVLKVRASLRRALRFLLVAPCLHAATA